MNTGLIILMIAVFALLVRVVSLDYRLYLLENSLEETELKLSQEQLDKIIDIIQESEEEDG